MIEGMANKNESAAWTVAAGAGLVVLSGQIERAGLRSQLASAQGTLLAQSKAIAAQRRALDDTKAALVDARAARDELALTVQRLGRDLHDERTNRELLEVKVRQHASTLMARAAVEREQASTIARQVATIDEQRAEIERLTAALRAATTPGEDTSTT